MSGSNVAQQIDETVTEESAHGAAEFVHARAMEILREWMNTPEIAEILDEAEKAKTAEAGREEAA